MRRVAFVVAAVALALVMASGVALAVNEVGTNGPDTLRGTNGNDNLIGKGGDDILLALAGKDTLLGGHGKDFLLGGSVAEPLGGHKTMVGGHGNDVLLGGFDSDTMVGGNGNDFMNGGEFEPPLAKDTLSGGAGNDVIDVINTAAGKDVVTCGGGVDRVIADRADVVAPDCEKVFVGKRKIDKYFDSIPESFFPGLAPFPEG